MNDNYICFLIFSLFMSAVVGIVILGKYLELNKPEVLEIIIFGILFLIGTAVAIIIWPITIGFIIYKTCKHKTLNFTKWS